MVNMLAWIVSTRLCRWPIWKIVLNGILKIYDGQLDIDNLLAWRASSFFLDKQISTLQISASPTQRHILSKEIPYSFPWAEQAYKLQTYQFSCSTRPQRLTIIIREEVLHFWEYLWRSWLTAKIQPPQNAKGDECGQYICAIFSHPVCGYSWSNKHFHANFRRFR